MNQWTRAALIALRIVVGWHFLYEGLWKIDSNTGSASYSPARYTLQATTARLHDYFAQAPADSFDSSAAMVKIDAWHDDIVRAFAAYKQLDDAQKARLAVLRDKVKLQAIGAARGERDVDEVANFDWAYVHQEVLKAAGEPDAEGFSSLGYLRNATGPFRPLFRGMIADIEAFERITPEAVASRIDARYREIVDHFDSAGKPLRDDQLKHLAEARDSIRNAAVGAISAPAYRSRVADYRNMAGRVQHDGSKTQAAFSRERLDADRKKLDLIADELLAIANEPLSELAVQVHLIATADQLSAGPLPRPADPAAWVDRAIKISLVGIGVCLLLGILPKWAGLAAAAQLAMFYLASPPWPGMPAASLGGHFLFVDRNLIELVASLVIAATAPYTALVLRPRRRTEELEPAKAAA